MADRVAVIAKLLTDLAAFDGRPIDPERADADALRASLAEHYPDLSVDEVRRAVAIASRVEPDA